MSLILPRRTLFGLGGAAAASGLLLPRSLVAQSVSVRDWVPVRQIGPLGTSDDSSTIQTAFTTANAAGCGVEFPPGNFYCNSITVPGDTPYRGQGRYITTLVNNSATAPTLTYSGGRIRGSHIGFSASVGKTGGTYVDMGTVGNNTLDDFYMELYWVGIQNSGTSVEIMNGVMLNSVVSTPGTGGSGGIIIGAAGVGYAQQISNVLMSDAGGATQAGFGIKIIQAGDLILDRMNIIAHGYDLYVISGSGQQCDSLWATNCFFDTAANGIVIQPTSGGFVGRARFDACWTSSHSGNGVSIGGPAGGTVSGVSFIGHHAFANVGSSGIGIGTGSTDVSVIGGTFAGNAIGIGVVPNITDFSIIGTACGAYDGFSGNTAYGIGIASGSSNNYIISNNRVSGNGIAGVNDGGTGFNKYVNGNV